MDASASPLVVTKISVPALRTRRVPRPHLVEALDAGLRAGLALVLAPAGYGKTSLLAEWAHSEAAAHQALAWLALDASDDNAIAFGSYLVYSLSRALESSAELSRLAQHLRAAPQSDLQQTVSAVINAVAVHDRTCVLVLDDYHLITCDAIHAAVAFLLDHLPPNLSLLISSRAEPPLPLARLRVRGQLSELRAADLCWSVAEAEIFLNTVKHLDLAPEMVRALVERTEGWIAGLQLAALSLANRSHRDQDALAFTGSQPRLADFLLEEVFSRLPSPTQHLLLASAILERVSPGACDALLGPGFDSAAILGELTREDLFVVPLDAAGTWFRYHHLFRDFLLTRLQQRTPGQLPALHRAASRWLEQHHHLREAARHAFQIGDWSAAAAFVERHSFTLILHSDITTVYEWCAVFPDDVLFAHPGLCLLSCWGLVFSYRHENRPLVQTRLQRADVAIAALDDPAKAQALREHAASLRLFLSLAPDPALNLPEQLTLAQERLAALPEADAGRFSALLTIGYIHAALQNVHAADQSVTLARQVARQARLYFGLVESTYQLARSAKIQGRLSLAEKLCRQGQTDLGQMLATPDRAVPALGSLDIALGAVWLERDRLAEAGDHLQRGLEVLGPQTTPHYLLTAYVALARLAEYQDRPDEVADALSRLEEAWPDIAFCVEGLRVEAALRSAPTAAETLAAAATWCRRYTEAGYGTTAAPGFGPFGAADAHYLARVTWIRARIALGEAAGVHADIDRLLQPATAHGLQERVLELSLLAAEAWSALGEANQAHGAIERALIIAQREGYLRIFDRGPGLRQLLRDVGRKKPRDSYATKIQTALGWSPAATPAGKGHQPGGQATRAEALTEREWEVLRLIAQGATNRDIGERLSISVGTVKSHANHILGKLGARNRTEAVARAQALKSLDL